jgi:hypothetical protein
MVGSLDNYTLRRLLDIHRLGIHRLRLSVHRLRLHKCRLGVDRHRMGVDRLGWNMYRSRLIINRLRVIISFLVDSRSSTTHLYIRILSKKTNKALE